MNRRPERNSQEPRSRPFRHLSAATNRRIGVAPAGPNVESGLRTSMASIAGYFTRDGCAAGSCAIAGVRPHTGETTMLSTTRNVLLLGSAVAFGLGGCVIVPVDSTGTPIYGSPAALYPAIPVATVQGPGPNYLAPVPGRNARAAAAPPTYPSAGVGIGSADGARPAGRAAGAALSIERRRHANRAPVRHRHQHDDRQGRLPAQLPWRGSHRRGDARAWRRSPRSGQRLRSARHVHELRLPDDDAVPGHWNLQPFDRRAVPGPHRRVAARSPWSHSPNG